jgi:hypothetical protein
MTSPHGGPPPTIGQAVGRAEAALTRLLNNILAERGISRETYLGLQRLTALGGQATRRDYEGDLSDWLGLDGPGACALADQLTAAGLVAADRDLVRLAGPAQALREGILVDSAKVTGPMLAALDRDDVETTIRTLQEITRRARGIPVRRTATEGKS